MSELRSATGCETVVPFGAEVPCADRYIADGEILQLGSVVIQAIATPGHTNAHLAYLINSERVLTGDALFIRGCGRTDFQSEDTDILYDPVTLKSKTLSSSPNDLWLIWILRALAVIAGAIALLIIVFLILESFPFL
jgi:glyoxylase-like metal-dependent hydrolase (beta-lactamase superfamily II)